MTLQHYDDQERVRVQAPPGVTPSGAWWDALVAQPCYRCPAQLMARFRYDRDRAELAYSPSAWDVIISHEPGCPAIGAPP